MARRTSPEPSRLTFAGILRKRCTDFVAARQQAWAEGPPIWKPLRSPSPSSPNSLFPENRRRSYPTTSWGFLWGWRPPPCFCHSTPGPHQLPRLCWAGPLPVTHCRVSCCHLLEDPGGCTAHLPQEALRSRCSLFVVTAATPLRAHIPSLRACPRAGPGLSVYLQLFSLFIQAWLEEYSGLSEPPFLFHIMEH